jgi:hypothetical protein
MNVRTLEERAASVFRIYLILSVPLDVVLCGRLNSNKISSSSLRIISLLECDVVWFSRCQRFGWTCCLCLQDRPFVSFSLYGRMTSVWCGAHFIQVETATAEGGRAQGRGRLVTFFETEEDWWGMQLGYMRNLCQVLVGEYGWRRPFWKSATILGD